MEEIFGCKKSAACTIFSDLPFEISKNNEKNMQSKKQKIDNSNYVASTFDNNSIIRNNKSKENEIPWVWNYIKRNL